MPLEVGHRHLCGHKITRNIFHQTGHKSWLYSKLPCPNISLTKPCSKRCDVNFSSRSNACWPSISSSPNAQSSEYCFLCLRSLCEQPKARNQALKIAIRLARGPFPGGKPSRAGGARGAKNPGGLGGDSHRSDDVLSVGVFALVLVFLVAFGVAFARLGCRHFGLRALRTRHCQTAPRLFSTTLARQRRATAERSEAAGDGGGRTNKSNRASLSLPVPLTCSAHTAENARTHSLSQGRFTDPTGAPAAPAKLGTGGSNYKLQKLV